MKIGVVVTVKNEAGSIRALLESLAGQSQPPDEVIVVDGGSSDGTPDIAAEYPFVRVMVKPGCNISEGRNAAIRAATADVIVSTDAGVRFDGNWLAALLCPFGSGAAPDVVCGFFVSDPRTTFELAMGATVLPALEDIRPERFMPSSRSVAFRRSAWEAVGGYPAFMSFSEDLLFDMALKARGLRFVFAPDAVVRFRPRSSLAAFWRQYRNYAKGDGEGLLWTKRHLIRYTTYLAVLPALVAGALFWTPWLWALLLIGAAAYLRKPYRRLFGLWRDLPLAEKLRAALWVPVIRVWGDLAKMVGYPMGVPRGWRQRGRTRAYLNRPT